MAARARDITTLAQLRAFAAELVARLRPGQLVALQGELGAGKTTCVKAVASALGIGEDQVISPTFVYEQIYPLPEPVHGIERLIHLDLYRLNRDQDLLDLDLSTGDQQSVLFVEWPERAPMLLQQADLSLSFRLGPTGERTVTIQGSSV